MREHDSIRDVEPASRIAYWRTRLAGGTLSQVPLDHPRPQRQTFASATIPLTIDRTTADGLRQAARAAGGALFHALAAAYAWWLHRYTDSTDVVFGATRDHRVAPMVLRCDVSDTESFSTAISRVCQVVTEALENAVPFETLQEGLDIPWGPRNNPLLSTALVLQPRFPSAADDWSLHIDIGDEANLAPCDISINLAEQPDGHLTGELIFCTELFDHGTIREMASHWCDLVDAVAAAPGIPMADHDVVTPAARQRQLDFNPTAAHDDSSQGVHEVISAQVARTPDAVAVQVGDTTLTYRQLDDRATVIAARLVQAGAGPGAVVAMLIDRTPDLVAAIVGILKSGAAFLPLDPRQPIARNAFCINEAAPNIIVTDRQLSIGGDEITALVINLDELGSDVPDQGVVCGAVSADDLAYVIYTSGSTGRPKGALIAHRGVTNLMHTMFSAMGITGSDTVLSVASISFDLALADIFCALACGARLVLATAEQAIDPAALSQLIVDSAATYLMATATTWAVLVAAGWPGDQRLTAVSVGETLHDTLAAALLQRCGSVWNGYGPSETTAATNVGRVAENDTITVGGALPNTRVYVTDRRGRLQPVGVPGEIVIGGASVARGYLDRPEEHARRFGDDPFHPGGRIFRTGDRGRFLPDGRIQHLGRYDDQVKIRGFRIEPGEIEAALSEHPGVACCAVVARTESNGEPQLAAYIVGESERPTEVEVRSWLRQRLPEYMVPRRLMYLAALPTTASGKLDKAALPVPSSWVPSGVDARPPGNDTERRIAALWTDVLAVPVADVTCDFFDMGGDSLLAVRLITEIRRAFGVRVSVAAFIDRGRTVAGLATLLDAATPARAEATAAVLPLHFIFAGLTSAMSLRHFAKQWGARQPVHMLVPDQPAGQFDRSVTIEQHARQALLRIRARQPDGPLVLAGYSIGGLVAYEVARQAVESGRQIQWLGVVDAVAPPTLRRLRTQLTWRSRLRRLRRQPARERWVKCVDAALRALGRGDPFDYPGAQEVVCRYQQPGHEVPIHLFVSACTATDVESNLLGWNEFHQGAVNGQQLAGNHAGLLEAPEVQRLAQLMMESLRSARRD